MKRLVAWFTALRPRAQDLALAVALTLVDVATLLPYRSQLHPAWLAFTLIVIETMPLIWRRTWPVAMVLIIGFARVSYDRIGLGYAPLPLGPAIAFFTVIDRCSPAIRRITCGLVVVGMITSQLSPGHNEPYDITVAALIFVTAWMAGVLSRTRRAYVREVEARADRAEAERDREASRLAAEQRTAIAREMHDVVAHHVSLMAVQAEAASSLLPGRPAEAARSVDIIGATARQALAELRRLLGVLRGPAEDPRTEPPATLADLGRVVDQIRDAGLAVELTVAGPPCELAPGTDLTAYRIVQEALTNAVRHAGASRAAVTLCYEPGFVTVRVEDSGARAHQVPAANGTGPGPGGFGLAGIAERVASCGGNLTLGPTDGGGFAVTARLPAR